MRRFPQSILVAFALTLGACDRASPPQAAAPPAPPSAAEGPPRGKRAPCDTDQSCNDDPAVSALWGRCVETVCHCEPGFELMPWGRCKPVK